MLRPFLLNSTKPGAVRQSFRRTTIALSMITEKGFAEMALSFPGTEPTPHFERTGFRVTGKRMFSTYLDFRLHMVRK